MNLLKKLVDHSETAVKIGISQVHVGHIIDTLFISEDLCTLGFMHVLGRLLKVRRLEIASSFFFSHCEYEGEAFLHSIMTADEMWVYHYKSEIKFQCMEYQYKHYLFSALKLVVALLHMSGLM
jgi:hypothetical protein